MLRGKARTRTVIARNNGPLFASFASPNLNISTAQPAQSDENCRCVKRENWHSPASRANRSIQRSDADSSVSPAHVSIDSRNDATGDDRNLLPAEMTFGAVCESVQKAARLISAASGDRRPTAFRRGSNRRFGPRSAGVLQSRTRRGADKARLISQRCIVDQRPLAGNRKRSPFHLRPQRL